MAPISPSAPTGYRIEDNALYRDTALLRERLLMIASGGMDTLLCAGPKGGGKSFLTESIVPSMGRVLVPFKGVTAHTFADFAHKYRAKRFVWYFDEADSIWQSEPLMNQLKLSLNPHGGPRSFTDNRPGKHGKIDIEAGCILLTNKQVFDESLSEFPRDKHGHVEALKIRFVQHHSMSFDAVASYHYAAWLATDGAHLLRNLTDGKNRHLTLAQCNEVLEWWHENWHMASDITARCLLSVAKNRLLTADRSPELWKALSASFLTHKRTRVNVGPPWQIRVTPKPRKTDPAHPNNRQPTKAATQTPVEPGLDGLKATMARKREQIRKAGKAGADGRKAKKQA